MRIVLLVALCAVVVYAKPQVRSGNGYGNDNGYGSAPGNGNGYASPGNGNGNGYGSAPGNGNGYGSSPGNGNDNGYGSAPGNGYGNGNTNYSPAPSNPYGNVIKQLMQQVQQYVQNVDISQQQVEQFSQLALKGVQNAVKILQAYQGGDLNMGFLQNLFAGGAGAVAPAAQTMGAQPVANAQAGTGANYDGEYY